MGDLHDVYVVDTQNAYRYGSARFVVVCTCGWNSAGGDIDSMKNTAINHFQQRTGIKYPNGIAGVSVLDNYKPFGKPLESLQQKEETKTDAVVEASSKEVYPIFTQEQVDKAKAEISTPTELVTGGEGTSVSPEQSDDQRKHFWQR
jgi:hypothetical protein